MQLWTKHSQNVTDSKSVCKNYYYVHLSIHMSPNYSGQKYCIFHVGIKPLTIEHLVDSIEAREKQPKKKKKPKWRKQ